jgi:cytidylate kinase-like protein
MINAITIEREFGCGAPEIASLVSSRLGWGLWDERLTQEIARLTDSTPEAVERREWRTDPVVYRVFQDFLRGGFEGGLPPTSRLHLLDAPDCRCFRNSSQNRTFQRSVGDCRPRFAVLPSQSRGCLPCFSLCISRSENPQTYLEGRNPEKGDRISRHNR